jgi:hypothetical protein
MRRFTKKRALAALGLVAVLAVAGVAIAYFTTTGAGTGTAAVGTSSVLTLHGTTTTTLYPGTSTPVNFTVDNPSTGHQFVGTITLTSVDAFTGPGFTNPIPVGVGAGKCDTSQFSMPAVAANQDVGTGSGIGIAATGTLTLADDATHTQDGCKNAVLRLNLTSN